MSDDTEDAGGRPDLEELRRRARGARGEPAQTRVSKAKVKAHIIDFRTRRQLQPDAVPPPKVPKTRIVNPELIALLESLLADARSGELRAGAVALIDRRGEVWVDLELHDHDKRPFPDGQAVLLLGALEILKPALLDIASPSIEVEIDE